MNDIKEAEENIKNCTNEERQEHEEKKEEKLKEKEEQEKKSEVLCRILKICYDMQVNTT